MAVSITRRAQNKLSATAGSLLHLSVGNTIIFRISGQNFSDMQISVLYPFNENFMIIVLIFNAFYLLIN